MTRAPSILKTRRGQGVSDMAGTMLQATQKKRSALPPTLRALGAASTKSGKLPLAALKSYKSDASDLSELSTAEEVVRREVAGIVLNLDGPLATEQSIERIFEVAERHKGDAHFHMDIEDEGDWFRVRSDSGVRITDHLLDELALLVGPENLSFTRM